MDMAATGVTWLFALCSNDYGHRQAAVLMEYRKLLSMP